MGDLIEYRVADFYNYTKERYNIHMKRQAGEPWPWTDDPVLQTYKFCNIYREDDVGTIWLRENIREPYANHPNLFFNICIYRQFNRVETAELIGFIDGEFDPDLLYLTVQKRKLAGYPIYTSAHMVRSAPRGICADKLTYTVYHVLQPLWHNLKALEPVPGEDTLETAYHKILQAYGFGHFLAYEVVTDCRHTRYLDSAPDIMTWANAGPGAIRGINRLCNEPVKATHSWRYHLRNMQELLSYSSEYIPHMPPWEMRDVEHTLCEFDKYERCQQGGRTRVKYKPPHMRL